MYLLFPLKGNVTVTYSVHFAKFLYTDVKRLIVYMKKSIFFTRVS